MGITRGRMWLSRICMSRRRRREASGEEKGGVERNVECACISARSYTLAPNHSHTHSHTHTRTRAINERDTVGSSESSSNTMKCPNSQAKFLHQG
jgi:hypothetical protein